MQKIGRVIALLIVCSAGFGLAGWFAGRASGRREMVLEAVKQGHAHFTIYDEQGNTRFEWGNAQK